MLDWLFRASDFECQKAFQNIGQQSLQASDPTVGHNAKAEENEFVATHPPSTFNDHGIKEAYYSMIETLGDQFGRLIDQLEARGKLENTQIISHSDHG